MANATALILLLIATAAAASASAQTTVVTDSSCGWGEEQMTPINSCMMWVQGQMRGPHAADERALKECCGELGRLSQDCRCEAAMTLMRALPTVQGRREACMLPSTCGFRDCGCPRVFI